MDGTPNSEANLNKLGVMVQYRGVKRIKQGMFGSRITDPKTGAEVWLGTFTSDIEAAKAYEKAAVEMHGPKARLNFPLEFGMEDGLEPNQATVNFPLELVISPPESNTAVPDARKRRKHGAETTEGKPNAPVHAVKWLRSSSRPVPSPPRRSPPIGSDENAKKDNFKWTDESLVAMCDILNKHIATNGRDCAFRWVDHQLEFEKVSGHKFKSFIALRSNHEAMRVKHNHWKLLKEGEIGLRWDDTAGKLDCSDDWWRTKVKENPDFKKFQRNQPSRKLQEAWDLLFDNVDSNGVPSVDPNKSKQVHYVNLEDDDDDDADEVHEDDNDDDKVDKLREAESAAMHKKTVTGPNASQQSGLKKEKTTSINQVGDSSISACMSVINRMVHEGLMTSCSELWCFAVNLFENDVKRELFMSMPDDVGRLAWLQFKQNLGH